MLICKKLDNRAILPTVSHPGEDLGFDLYALETVYLEPFVLTKVRTGIAARFIDNNAHYATLGGDGPKIEKIFGLLLRDRSSLAAKKITVSGGVIDAGYSNEIVVMLTNHNASNYESYVITEGDKIVQAIPIPVETNCGIEWVDELPDSSRALKGFGSSGK